MALTQRLSNEAANAEVAALAAQLDGGYLDIYSGVQPTLCDDPITTQVLLASLPLSDPAFGSPAEGEVAANAIGDEVDAPASGEATWYRFYKADHLSPVQDGSVGTIDCNLNLTDVNIVAHAVVSVSSFTLRAKKS